MSELDLSVVVPVYNEEPNIELLAQEVHEALDKLPMTYEAIFVDDGSSDGSWQKLCEAAERYPHFVVIRFRRNFRQTAAMSAGFHHARGDIVVPLDADLQNPPAELPKLLERMEEGVDVVSGWRKERKDNIVRTIPSRLANAIISKITGVHLHDYGCSLKAYRREVLDNVRLYGEMHRFIPALASWVGGKVVEVPVAHRERHAGEAKYGKFALGRTFRVVLDLITVKFLTRYAMGPMQIFGKIGSFFGAIGLLFFGLMFLDLLFGFTGGTPLYKRPFWVMTAFMFILFCIQFISMGLLAEIQIRTYHESQDKPTYVVKEIRRSPEVGASGDVVHAAMGGQ